MRRDYTGEGGIHLTATYLFPPAPLVSSRSDLARLLYTFRLGTIVAYIQTWHGLCMYNHCTKSLH